MIFCGDGALVIFFEQLVEQFLAENHVGCLVVKPDHMGLLVGYYGFDLFAESFGSAVVTADRYFGII